MKKGGGEKIIVVFIHQFKFWVYLICDMFKRLSSENGGLVCVLKDDLIMIRIVFFGRIIQFLR